MYGASNLTARIANYATRSSYDDLPDEVRHEAVRSFVNWMGVAVGGCREPAVRIAGEFAAAQGGAPRSSVIGQSLRTDPASAALVNCISSAVLGYDDAYLPSVAHPSGPACSALFAIAEDRQVSGRDFVLCLALAIEIQCRVADLLCLPPSQFESGIYINGFSGPIGVAAGVSRLIGLEEERTNWAIGLAASQASGFRGTHGTMTAHFRAGHCCRSGVVAALLAERGFDCAPNALEGPTGLLDVFAKGADPAHVLEGLGERYAMLNNRYKPYPCAIVIHPSIDACLALRKSLPDTARIEAVRLFVNPAVLMLTDRQHPKTTLEALNSVQHWAATALLLGAAGLPEMKLDCVNGPDVVELRRLITVTPQHGLSKAEVSVEVVLSNGRILREQVTRVPGSLDPAMTDRELNDKFDGLAAEALDSDAALSLRTACWQVEKATDVGATFRALLP